MNRLKHPKVKDDHTSFSMLSPDYLSTRLPLLLCFLAYLLLPAGLGANPDRSTADRMSICLELIDSADLRINGRENFRMFVPTADKYYLADDWSGFICVYDHHGQLIRRIGTFGNGPGKFTWVGSIAIRDSLVYGTDGKSILVNEFDTAGNAIDYWKFDSTKYSQGMMNCCAFGNGSLIADQTYRSEVEPLMTKRGKFKGSYPVSPLMRIDLPERKTRRVAFTLKAWSEIKVALNYPEFWNVMVAAAPAPSDQAYCCWRGIPALFEIDTRACTARKLCGIPVIDWIDVHKQQKDEMKWPNWINSFAPFLIEKEFFFMVEILKYRNTATSNPPVQDCREYYIIDSTGSLAYVDRNADLFANNAGVYMQDNAAYFCTLNSCGDPSLPYQTIMRIRRYAIKQIK
jgi:hypothetical protein